MTRLRLPIPRTLRGQLLAAALVVITPLFLISAAEIVFFADRDSIDDALYLASVQLLVAAAITAIAIHVLIRLIGRPLQALQESARAYGRHEPPGRVAVESGSPVELAEVVGTYNAMTARIEGENERLRHHAMHDELTGLANRSLFLQDAARALSRARRAGAKVALLYFDIDDFKLINDSLGHTAGDALLRRIGERIAGTIRLEESAARLGGDEFVIIAELPGESESAEAAAETLAERLIEAISRPFEFEGERLRLGASAGVVIADGTEAVEDLLSDADIAMYRAKEDGRGSHTFFAVEMRGAVEARLRSANELRDALEEHQFVLHYQPIVDLSSGRAVGIEALCRWQHPERGLVSPAQFIPTAERTGLIWELGRRILSEACREGRRLVASDSPLTTIAVNLSARQLLDPRLSAHVSSALEAHSLAPEHLTLEITESAIVSDFEAARAQLATLKALGVGLAIDDFGTGYTSLAYLRDLPVDQIKIAGEFVREITASERDAALLRAIIEIGEVLGRRTVAEMVETDAVHQRLRGMGCELGQGYFYAKPMPADELAALLDGGGVLVAERELAAAVSRRDLSGAEGSALESIREILRAMGDTVLMVFDLDGRWTLAEGVPLEQTGWRASEFVGRRPSEALPPERGSELERHVARALEGKRETFIWPSTKGHRVLSLSLLPRRDGGGAVVGALLVGRDLGTEQVADSLDQAAAQPNNGEPLSRLTRL